MLKCVDCDYSSNGSEAKAAKGLIGKLRKVYSKHPMELVSEDSEEFLKTLEAVLDSVKNIGLLRVREEKLEEEWKLLKYVLCTIEGMHCQSRICSFL